MQWEGWGWASGPSKQALGQATLLVPVGPPLLHLCIGVRAIYLSSLPFPSGFSRGHLCDIHSQIPGVGPGETWLILCLQNAQSCPSGSQDLLPGPKGPGTQPSPPRQARPRDALSRTGVLGTQRPRTTSPFLPTHPGLCPRTFQTAVHSHSHGHTEPQGHHLGPGSPYLPAQQSPG